MIGKNVLRAAGTGVIVGPDWIIEKVRWHADEGGRIYGIPTRMPNEYPWDVPVARLQRDTILLRYRLDANREVLSIHEKHPPSLSCVQRMPSARRSLLEDSHRPPRSPQSTPVRLRESPV